MKLIPVILSGGSGTRLWPISRASFPKQFCELLDESLFSKTLKRLKNFEPSVIITSDKLVKLTEKEIKQQNFLVRKVIYETEGKNTAPAVALACRYLELSGMPDQVCGIFASDALITNQGVFESTIQNAANLAASGQVVVLGLKPDRVETGFGYIQIQNSKLDQAAPVLRFHEKPNYQTAEKFINDGNYFWNAGIFIFKVSKMIELFKQHQPEMWSAISAVSLDLKNIDSVYSKVKNISFDYAVIEKLESDQLSCIPCDMGWSDLGSWDVMDQIQTAQPDTVHLTKPSVQIESQNVTVFSNEKKQYAVIGLSDIIVVDTGDALLICKKGESQKVKDVLSKITIAASENRN